MAASVPATGSLPRTAEVVVIGGGVNGASTACQLARRGQRDIVLLERGHLGAGATGKSGALVRCHYANPHEAKLAAASVKVFQHWGDAVGHGDPGFEAVGFVQVVAPEDEANLRANVAAQQGVGVETSIVSADDLREIEPLLRTDDLIYAAFEPGSGFADPNGAVYGFAAAFAARGGQICLETEATAILTEGDHVAGVETSRGRIATRTVVLAGGAFADRLLRPLGLDFGLTPWRAQVAIFRQPPGVDPRRRHRAVIDSTLDAWFRPEGSSGTLIGLEPLVRDAPPEGYKETLDDEAIARARAMLARRCPAFARATMRGGWAGVYTMSPDSHPIIDHVPSVPGLYVMVGDSGTSFKTSPAIGICLAEWIVDGQPSLVDLAPFRSTRFADGQPWLDEHAYGDGRARSISR